jgi:hypothetical protein
VTKCHFIDHNSIESIHHLQENFNLNNGMLNVIGLQNFKNVHGSNHHAATRKKK